jgi:hypothetical protein
MATQGDQRPHSRVLTPEQANAGLMEAAAQLRQRNYVRTAEGIEECTRNLFEQLEAARKRIEEAEGIIHSAVVTGSDPAQALRDAMDALGGESIPIATASSPAKERP